MFLRLFAVVIYAFGATVFKISFRVGSIVLDNSIASFVRLMVRIVERLFAVKTAMPSYENWCVIALIEAESILLYSATFIFSLVTVARLLLPEKAINENNKNRDSPHERSIESLSDDESFDNDVPVLVGSSKSVSDVTDFFHEENPRNFSEEFSKLEDESDHSKHRNFPKFKKGVISIRTKKKKYLEGTAFSL